MQNQYVQKLERYGGWARNLLMKMLTTNLLNTIGTLVNIPMRGLGLEFSFKKKNINIIKTMKKSYFDELKRAMEFLATDRRTVFLGQAVKNPGTAMFNTLKNIKPQCRALELPVSEDFQMVMFASS